MAYIITSKTRSKARRDCHINTPSHGKTVYEGQSRDQYKGVSKQNREEFRHEKRILELHKKGFNEAAITGMMFTGKEAGMEGHVKEVIRKQKSKIKTDGNI